MLTADPELRFQLLLCRTLGRTLSELDELPAWELALWAAEYELSPWGEQRDEIGRAVIGAAVCGSMGVKVQPADLIPKWGEGRRRMTKDDWLAFVAAHNKKVQGG